MGDQNQLTYLKRNVPSVAGPVLEVGSKDYGNTSTYRDFYRDVEYIGIDMENGKGVDAVVDLVESTHPLKRAHFDLAICCSVLEHVRKPWIFANNLGALIRPAGRIYMSVPWVWRYHPYPDDYFRFSWRGVMELFPEFSWSAIEYSTNVEGEFFPITKESQRIDDQMSRMLGTSYWGGKKRKYLPYLMVNMIGRRSL